MTNRSQHQLLAKIVVAVTLGAMIGTDVVLVVPSASAQRVVPYQIPRVGEPGGGGPPVPPLPVPSLPSPPTIRDTLPSFPQEMPAPRPSPLTSPAPPPVPRLLGQGPCAPVLTVRAPGAPPTNAWPQPQPGTPGAPTADPSVRHVASTPVPGMPTLPGMTPPPAPAPMPTPTPTTPNIASDPMQAALAARTVSRWEEPPSRIEKSFQTLLAAVTTGATSAGPILTRPVPTFTPPPLPEVEPPVRGIATPTAQVVPEPAPSQAEPEEPLRQYGYATFASAVSTFAPVDDVPVGPDYVLGPGDDLTINIWGPVDASVVRTVDRNGAIVLPKVGDLRVWGLSFAQADRLIREQIARYYKGFQTSVTMGRLRTIRVHVVGEVCQPGVYTLSSLSTVTNALFSAGGPTRLGSLREIRLLRNSHQVGTVDLYDFMLRGDRTQDFRLESGDTVFVSTIGDVAAVVGEVKRPGIYELRGETPVGTLLDLAGGLTPSSRLRRVQVIRAQPSAERVTIDLDLTRPSASPAPTISPGDLVIVHPSDPRIYNIVRVTGAVKHPGAYEVKPDLRLSQLLPRDEVLPEANSRRVEIARRQENQSMAILSVDLERAWQGRPEHDLVLKPLDEITIRSDLRDVRSVVLTGQVVRPGRYVIAENERLSSVIERAGGFTERAFLKGAFFQREGLRRAEQERLNEFVRLQEQRFLAQAATPVVGADREDVALGQLTLSAQRAILRSLASRVALGRVVVRLDDPGRLRGTENDITLIDGDRLDVPEPPTSVFVIGAVRSSTSVMYQPATDLDYYLRRVGGVTPEADKKQIHIVKADGSAIASFTNVRDIESGDTIVVPPKQEEKVRLLPTLRDVMGVMGGVLLSIAALAVLF